MRIILMPAPHYAHKTNMYKKNGKGHDKNMIRYDYDIILCPPCQYQN